MFKKNKKGISPLIATVLIIGFTIVLAALVITWGTKLFQSTVSQTETTSKFSLACTTGLSLEIIPGAKTETSLELKMRNNNQDQAIDDFMFILSDAQKSEQVAKEKVESSDQTNKLGFAVPKTYTLNKAEGGIAPNTATKVEVYPVFNLDGVTKACSSPVEVKLA